MEKGQKINIVFGVLLFVLLLFTLQPLSFFEKENIYGQWNILIKQINEEYGEMIKEIEIYFEEGFLTFKITLNAEEELRDAFTKEQVQVVKAIKDMIQTFNESEDNTSGIKDFKLIAKGYKFYKNKELVYSYRDKYYFGMPYSTLNIHLRICPLSYATVFTEINYLKFSGEIDDIESIKAFTNVEEIHIPGLKEEAKERMREILPNCKI